MKKTLHVPFSLRTPSARAAFAAVEILQKSGHAAFFVGGVVRDMLLGRIAADADVATSARPEEVIRLFEKSVPIGVAFGIVVVVIDGVSVEVATFREERGYSDGRRPDRVIYGNDPELDATRRDFTVNGLFYDPVRGEVLDFVGGIEDLRRGVLRCIGDAAVRFSEDRLRILRAARFAASLRFELDEETFRAALRFSDRLTEISGERIRTELEKILVGPDPEGGFRLLDRIGVLKTVLPEIDALHGMEQPPKYHPEGDVFEHTMLMLGRAAWKIPELMWSALLHDVGKAVSQTWKDGIPHFYGHEDIGSRIAERIMRRLHFSNATIEAVVAAVRNHMRFAQLDKMKPARWKRIMAEPGFPMELELHRLDCGCSHGMMGIYLLSLDRMKELAAAPIPKEPLLTGLDLIERGLTPGPAFGALLREVEDLRLEGVLNTRDDALEWLAKRKA